jgi:general secretion pathway protein D
MGNAVETSFDARTNQVVVIAAKGRMNDAREIIKALDTEVAQEQSPIKFYKLANATAADVLATIRSLEGEDAGGGSSAATTPRAGGGRNARPERTTPGGIRDVKPSAGESGGVGGGGVSPLVPASATGTGIAAKGMTERNSAAAPASPTTPAAYGGGGAAAGDPLGALRQDARARQAKVTADPNTNSIIVVAPPDVQRQYDQLIKALDKRRPQVLVECTIVTLDTSNNFELGVEVAQKSEFGSNKLITFSSFGLSTPDPTTGRLALTPGLGFNGALVSSDIAEVIVHALQQNTRARVSSAPRILVNDNNVGTLSSLSEFPYASVNASQTVATTSFGDYAQAGTEITVTPHISESDYLQLEYSVVLSSFTGKAITQGGTTLPPPRKSDSVQSEVTIPDGSTIIVGGLNRKNFSKTVDAVPLLGEVPILGYLFGNRANTDSTTTLFVFIRPIILRDDKFADLKFLSETDVKAAELPGDFPASEPLTVR